MSLVTNLTTVGYISTAMIKTSPSEAVTPIFPKTAMPVSMLGICDRFPVMCRTRTDSRARPDATAYKNRHQRRPKLKIQLSPFRINECSDGSCYLFTIHLKFLRL